MSSLLRHPARSARGSNRRHAASSSRAPTGSPRPSASREVRGRAGTRPRLRRVRRPFPRSPVARAPSLPPPDLPWRVARGESHLCDPSPDASTTGRHGSSHRGEGTSCRREGIRRNVDWLGGRLQRRDRGPPSSIPVTHPAGWLSPPLPRATDPTWRADRTAGRGTGGRRARSPRRRPAPASRRRRRWWRWLRTDRRREELRGHRDRPERRRDASTSFAIARSVPARRTKPRGRITDAIELSRALLRAAASGQRRNNSS